MSFTYITGIPNGPNNPSTDQPNMKTNTNSISSLIAVDHVGFNLSNGGVHNKTSYLAQSGDPANAATIAQLYSKTTSGNTELFLKKASTDSNGANSVIQMTNTRVGAASGSAGYTFLPGGTIMMWFTTTLNSSSNTVAFASAGLPNFPNAAFGATLGNGNASAIIGYTALSTSQITFTRTPSGSVTIFVVILGN